MLLGILFVLGTVNFAVHKAVLESNHPMLDTLPQSFTANGGKLSLVIEFCVLIVAMALSNIQMRKRNRMIKNVVFIPNIDLGNNAMKIPLINELYQLLKDILQEIQS